MPLPRLSYERAIPWPRIGVNTCRSDESRELWSTAPIASGALMNSSPETAVYDTD